MTNPYLEQLQSELDSYTAQCGITRPESVLDLLWYCYSSAKVVDDGYLKRCEDALQPVYQELSVTSEDMLFDMICNLVTAYQRAAFLEGMQTGAQLCAQLLNA